MLDVRVPSFTAMHITTCKALISPCQQIEGVFIHFWQLPENEQILLRRITRRDMRPRTESSAGPPWLRPRQTHNLDRQGSASRHMKRRQNRTNWSSTGLKDASMTLEMRLSDTQTLLLLCTLPPFSFLSLLLHLSLALSLFCLSIVPSRSLSCSLL